MSKKQVCKTCKLFVEGNTCPNCKENNFTTSWQGRIYINDAINSLIAGKINVKAKGEYAIKTR